MQKNTEIEKVDEELIDLGVASIETKGAPASGEEPDGRYEPGASIAED